MKFFFFTFLILFACQSKIEVTESLPQKGFVHTVYFYLDDNLSEDEKKSFALVLDTLAKIPSIEKVFYGPPAMTPRKVVDNSYDYAWVCIFKDKAGHDSYQNHPLHKQFKKRYTPMITDVKIYDNLY